jgi:hypothetical protein
MNHYGCLVVCLITKQVEVKLSLCLIKHHTVTMGAQDYISLLNCDVLLHSHISKCHRFNSLACNMSFCNNFKKLFPLEVSPDTN